MPSRLTRLSIILLCSIAISAAGTLTDPALPLTILTLMTDAGKSLPAVSPVTPAYYVLQSGGYHETGWPAPKNELTRSDLDSVLQAALTERGYQLAEAKHAPTLAMVYYWGAHNKPESSHPDLGIGLFNQNVLERAALVGGKAFAQGLRAALVDAAAVAETNAQGLSGTGGPAAIAVARMTAMKDPVARFKERSEKNEFLFEQALADCFFVIVSAYTYDATTAQKGALVWRTNVTVRADHLTQKQAYAILISEAASSYGLPMSEPVTLRRSRKSLPALLPSGSPKR